VMIRSVGRKVKSRCAMIKKIRPLAISCTLPWMTRSRWEVADERLGNGNPLLLTAV
jgi:hypothetical protein